MKKPYLKKVSVRVGIALALISILFIVHSCRKDLSTPAQQPTTLSQTDLTQLQAIYNAGISTNSSLLSVNSTGTTGANSLIQNLNVNWNSYVIKNRADNSQVVEFDMQPDAGTMLLTKPKAGDTLYIKNKSCALFIKLNNGTRLNVFMKVIEDYHLTHQSVIGNLHYRQIPATFSGQILYYTLDKKYINGYLFTNGKITGIVTMGAGPTTKQQVAGLQTNVAQDADPCGWLDEYCEDNCGGPPAGNSVLYATPACSSEYALYYVDCPPYDPGDDGDDDTGDTGGVTGDTGGSTGGGGGSSSSSNAVQTITNNVQNVCLSSIISNLTSSNGLQTDFTNMLRNTFVPVM